MCGYKWREEHMSGNTKLTMAMKRYALFFILLGLILLFAILSSDFFSFNNLMNILKQNAYLIIASIGVALVMISGGTDLSVGYQISVVAVCTGAFMQWLNLPIWFSIILGLLVGTLLGSLNGLLSNKLKIHSMIVTLATMTAFQGVSYTISGSKAIYNLDPAFKFIGQGYIGGIPFPAILVIIIAIIVSFILRETYFGRYIYAVGGNAEAARLAGINVERIKLAVFGICGFLCGCASIVMVGRAGSANSSMGPGTEFNAITACVLGGVSFIGGEGNVLGVIVGVLILGVLSNGMQLLHLGVYVQYIVKGVILIAAIGFDTYQKQSKVKKMKNAEQNV